MPSSTLVQACLTLAILITLLSPVKGARLVKHDASFIPDIVLRVCMEVIQLNCHPRLSTLINGTYPAPPIYLEPEQTTWIRVYNEADVNVTMHWHGLSLSAAPYADGSPQASQWPIPPGRFFDYELYPSASEAGTSFYHSHVGFQAITASGPLIVKDALPPPYAYDDEIILKIGDFYPEDDHTIETQLTSVPWKWTGDPTSLLINGRSGTAPNSQNPQRPADPSCEPWIMNVEPGKVYRVRVIGSTALSLVLFGIEDHDNLTIIETDNSYVYPVETTYMQVDSGQRFSFLLKTKSLEELEEESAEAGGKTSYWIQFETREAQGVVSAWARLNYAVEESPPPVESGGTGAAAPYPASASSPPQPSPCPDAPPPLPPIPISPILALPTNVTDWLEYTFQNPPLPGYDPPPTSSEVTRRITISTMQFLNTTNGHTVMLSNNASWFDEPPLGPSSRTPYLVELLSNGTVNGFRPDYDHAVENDDDDCYDPRSKTYPAKIGEVLEIVWQNAPSFPAGIYGPHPLHAHGGPYWDMGSGPGEYQQSTHEALLREHSSCPPSSSLVSGVTECIYPGSRRDTTILYKYTLRSRSESDTSSSSSNTPSTPIVNGWRVWRIRVTERNIGVWMMHCHILQHVVMGQQVVWVFGTPEEIREHVWPVEGVLDGYFVYGGDVVGMIGTGAGTETGPDAGVERDADGTVNVVQYFE